MKVFHIPRIFQKLFPSLIWQVPTTEKVIYLTFDDGPTTELTSWITKTLSSYQAKGTFFCVGDNLQKHPEYLLKLLEAGHTVANHSFNHLKGWNTPLQEYITNVEKCETLTKNKIFRPPYGRIRLSQIKALKNLNYKIIMWDIMSYDFDPNLDVNLSYQKIIAHTKPGSILVFHDNIKAEHTLKYLLPKIMDYFQSQGYLFKAIQ